ncbi:DH domain-containing protein [Aphelenchoides bicaudatus]|nr:DH domain-containing protein [Aphelenchoides bicaudatus]
MSNAVEVRRRLNDLIEREQKVGFFVEDFKESKSSNELSELDESKSIREILEMNSKDGYMEVQNQRIKVKDLADILISRFAFISGLRTKENHPILTFPDSRAQLTFDEYHLLIAYLFQFPPLEEDSSCSAENKKAYIDGTTNGLQLECCSPI